MSTARVTFRIDESLHDRLAFAAKSTGKTESDVVREAMVDYLDRNQGEVTAYDLFKEAGSIGCYRGGPKDLSTNPKYLEGFGRD
jgi:predicted DNA-binding protein